MKNRLNGAICYLAGPIEFSSDYGVSWRIKATEFLKSIGIGIINPLDKPGDYVKEDESIHNWIKELKGKAEKALDEGNQKEGEKYLDEYAAFFKKIVSIDLKYVDKSDFLLVYVNKSIYTCGTFHETAHAFIQRKPVVIFTEGNITNIPAWLFGHANYKMFFPSLDKSLDYIRHIHEDENIDTLNRWKFVDYRKVFQVGV